MFSVDPTTRKISLHRGDTGEVTFTALGMDFTSDDRALLTIKSGSGTEILHEYFEMDNGSFTKEFTNPMTDYLTPGQYKYDVRYIQDPVWSGEGDAAQIVDGAVVCTPGSPYIFEVLDTVGQI